MLSERQQEIIEKSVDLIAEKGIQGFTIKNISKIVGISEAGIYYHFESKTEIILTILTSFHAESQTNFENLNNNKKDSFEKITAFFSAMLNIFELKPSVVSVIFSEEIFQNEPALVEEVKITMNSNQEYIVRFINQGKESNLIRMDIDSEFLSLFILGAIRLLVKNWKNNGMNFSLKDKGNQLIMSFIEMTKR
ncbi:MAG: TetR/AcrR family transcriptional regulator [Bacteroidales bacterium]|jgi:AcrR family transcriptional regulator|nr:TetR/AcrR family transcriptional regulator [Bacteroidales bacterium]